MEDQEGIYYLWTKLFQGLIYQSHEDFFINYKKGRIGDE